MISATICTRVQIATGLVVLSLACQATQPVTAPCPPVVAPSTEAAEPGTPAPPPRAQKLVSRYEGLELRVQVVPGERHAGVKPEAYNRALRFAFEPWSATQKPD